MENFHTSIFSPSVHNWKVHTQLYESLKRIDLHGSKATKPTITAWKFSPLQIFCQWICLETWMLHLSESIAGIIKMGGKWKNKNWHKSIKKKDQHTSLTTRRTLWPFPFFFSNTQAILPQLCPQWSLAERALAKRAVVFFFTPQWRRAVLKRGKVGTAWGRPPDLSCGFSFWSSVKGRHRLLPTFS